MQAPSAPASLKEPPDFASFFEEGADVGMAHEEEPELVAEDSSTLFTRGVREIVPWPVEILDLPDPTEPELLATGTSERHSAEGASNLRPRDALVLSHPCVPAPQTCCSGRRRSGGGNSRRRGSSSTALYTTRRTSCLRARSSCRAAPCCSSLALRAATFAGRSTCAATSTTC